MKTNYRKIKWSKWQLITHGLLAASITFAQGSASADYLVYDNTSAHAHSASSADFSTSNKSTQNRLEELLSRIKAVTERDSGYLNTDSEQAKLQYQSSTDRPQIIAGIEDRYLLLNNLAYRCNMDLLTSVHKQLISQLTSIPYAQDNLATGWHFTGWHFMGDVGYTGTDYKGAQEMDTNGPNVVIGGYHSKYDTILGAFVGGGVHNYHTSIKNSTPYMEVHGHSSLLGGGVFGRWSPKSFWIAASLQAGNLHLTNQNIDRRGDKIPDRFAYSAYCGVGYDYAWNATLGSDYYVSYLHSHIGSSRLKNQPSEDRDYFDGLTSNIIRIGNRIHYNCSDRTMPMAQHTFYAGVAYERECSLKLGDYFEGTGKNNKLSPNSFIAEAGYNFGFKGWSVKLSATGYAAKIKRGCVSLSLGYNF